MTKRLMTLLISLALSMVLFAACSSNPTNPGDPAADKTEGIGHWTPADSNDVP